MLHGGASRAWVGFARISGHIHRAERVEPCPDRARGFRWPVFIGGAHPLERATVIRVDADAAALARS
jgi:hypothetical protein